MTWNKNTFITAGIVGGLVFGGWSGQWIFQAYQGQVPAGWIHTLEFIGRTFFIGLLMMIVIPLVATSVIMGVSSIGDVRRLGKIGSYTMLYYFGGMIIACTVGVTMVSMIEPGAGMGVDMRQQGEAMYEGQDMVRSRTQTAAGKGLWGAVENIASQLIPANPIGAAADGQVLPVIAFSLLMGVMLSLVGDKAQPVLAVVEGVYQAIMKLVDGILWLAPLGVFALVAATVCRVGLVQLIGPLAWYVLTVLVGLLIQALVVMTLALWILGRTNPLVYLYRVRTALLTAFGTSSSSASLPVTMDVATRFGGVSRKAAGFVIPLGATVNMNGTALYEAVAVVFLFQCYGIALGPVELAIVVITATLAAIGAAGIPSAGLVTMVLVVEAVNNSLGLTGEQRLPLAAVGIILGVDRFLDMCRTTVNVWDDLVGAKIIGRWLPDDPVPA